MKQAQKPVSATEPGSVTVPPAADAYMTGRTLRPRTRTAAVRDAAGAVLGTVMGIVPHVMHHVGILAGAVLVTGATGNAVFFVIGLLFSIPLLRRIYRRFGTWLAPAAATAVFAGMFSLSAFVIGPALTGAPSAETPPVSPPQTIVDEHSGHHQ